MDRPEPVPYLVHEGTVARWERANRRLVIIIFVLLAIIAGCVVGLFVQRSMYEAVTVSAEQEADGGNNYAVGGDFYGEAEGND